MHAVMTTEPRVYIDRVELLWTSSANDTQLPPKHVCHCLISCAFFSCGRLIPYLFHCQGPQFYGYFVAI